MLKSFGNFIHRTPWWGFILGGLATLAALVMFAAPIQLLRLSDSGSTPAEKSAIKREINLAFGDRALDIAESVVGRMKKRATDPDRVRELNHALAEMARAREELSRAQAGIAADSAQDANDAALEAATSAADAALASATDATQGIEEARAEAAQKLREKGVDPASMLRAFDELLKTARESEKTARESLAAIHALPHALLTPSAPKPNAKSATAIGEGTTETVQPSLPPAEPRASSGADALTSEHPTAKNPSTKAKKSAISIHFDAGLPSGVLSPETRNDIRAKVAGDVWRIGVGSALILLFIPLFIMLLIAKYFIGRSRRALAFAEEKKQEAKVSDVSRQITEARLQALQAQVEPHFLYNTLANVQALTEFDPPAANAMVGHLIQYLRAALPKMRESTSTIGQEVDLVTAYLNILKMRMGDRLTFGIDVPAELRTKSFPPMMLPSLVENAIKHGLEPLREGGRIDVVVTRIVTPTGERIKLQVKDTGKGLSDTPTQVGGGVGLANLRERLTALYGDDARFTLESNVPRGMIATIEIPAGIPTQAFSSTSAPAAGPTPDARPDTTPGIPADAPKGWRRAWQATSKTHSAWAWIVTRLFFALMVLLGAGFIIALIGLYTGWLPVDLGELHLEGIEGMAIGSVILLAAFVIAAVAIALAVAVFYGLGFLVAALLVLIPAIVAVSLFPVLSPFILIGLAIYWFFWRRRKNARKSGAV